MWQGDIERIKSLKKDKVFKKENGRDGLKRACVDAIEEKYGTNSWVYCPSDRFRKAIPDLIISFFGLFVSIELKLPGEELKPLQKYTKNKILDSDGLAFESHTVSDVLYILHRVKEEYIK